MGIDYGTWWVPQVPMESFEVKVDSVKEAGLILETLARYDLFQYENKIKPDYANAGGLVMFDPEDATDSPDGIWVDWCDEETGEDDVLAFLN